MQKQIAQLFGIDAPAQAVVNVREKIAHLPAEAYPCPDECYVFAPVLLKKLLRFFSGAAARKNCMLIGAAGAGKSSIVIEIAARLGWPLFSMACSGKTRFQHMVGSRELKDGKTVWKDGPLTLAMRHGGVFLANEITRLDSGEQMNLAEALDGRATLTIPDTGEIIVAHSNFRFIATGNSGGFGDSNGAYTGERVSSFAFLDRFQKYTVDYLSFEEESKILEKKAPALPLDIRNMMIRLAQETRNSFVGAGGALRVVISTRSLCCWAQESIGYSQMRMTDPVMEALMDTVLNGVPEEDANVVVEMLKNWINPPQV